MTKFKVGDKVKIVASGHDDSDGSQGYGFPSSVVGSVGIIDEIDDGWVAENTLVAGEGIKFNTAWGENTVWGSSEHLELVQ